MEKRKIELESAQIHKAEPCFKVDGFKSNAQTFPVCSSSHCVCYPRVCLSLSCLEMHKPLWCIDCSACYLHIINKLPVSSRSSILCLQKVVLVHLQCQLRRCLHNSTEGFTSNFSPILDASVHDVLGCFSFLC